MEGAWGLHRIAYHWILVRVTYTESLLFITDCSDCIKHLNNKDVVVSAIAGKVMSVGNLSLAPLKPSALPLRWPEELEWVWWAVPCSDLIIFRPERNSSLIQGLWEWFMQIAALSLDLGNLWLDRFLEKILTFLFGTWLGEWITTW